MNRRDFIKSSTALTLPVILQSCDWKISNTDHFDIKVHSNAKIGHFTFEKSQLPRGGTIHTDILIVGGGLSGIAAAYKLRDKDILLLELSDHAGGSSSAGEDLGLAFSMGAHYDLSYPGTYGEEVLAMLENLGVISYQPWKKTWTFTDRQHIVPNRRKNRCFDHGEYRDDVLEEGKEKEIFQELILPYGEKMTLPSRLIHEEYQPLNNISFLDFLNSRMKLSEHFVRCLDYNMRDDYGGTTEQVSALAGIHYFICRPYYTEIIDLFSPPEGNNYFVKKILAQVPSTALKLNSLVKAINPVKYGFEAEVLDVAKGEIYTVKANKVIYAGQKHAVKHVFSADANLFSNNRYAPWLVVNIILKNELEGLGYWQNEIISPDPTFLGFVDSNMQHPIKQDLRVLTAYYCLPENMRDYLMHVETNKRKIAHATITRIEEYMGVPIASLVRSIHMKPMGHAMPIPVPGYLFRDANDYRSNKNLVYAGVDNGRLPLLFDALDSGLTAARLLYS
ncbi:MAG: FAD-dependent oxidoreductase [Cyclobacteriaceae bacterium]|nr:FAD-dependent oxidoreductase [Cyclobacteriaceae bacterium]